MELAVFEEASVRASGVCRVSTGQSRNTVRRYLRGGDAVAKRKPAPKRAEKLDPFKAYIVGRMKSAALPDCIPAMRYVSARSKSVAIRVARRV